MKENLNIVLPQYINVAMSAKSNVWIHKIWQMQMRPRNSRQIPTSEASRKIQGPEVKAQLTLATFVAGD